VPNNYRFDAPRQSDAVAFALRMVNLLASHPWIGHPAVEPAGPRSRIRTEKTSLVFCSKTFCVVRQSVTRCWPQLLATRTARLVPLASLIAGAWSSAARRSSPGAGLGRSQLGHPGLSSRGPATLVCRLVWSQAARRSSPEPYVSEAARSNKLAPCVCTVLPRLVASGSPELTRTLRRAPLSR